MTRYTQDQNFLIKGPGLPETGAVSVGVRELEAAFEAGMLAGMCHYRCRGNSPCVGCQSMRELEAKSSHNLGTEIGRK